MVNSPIDYAAVRTDLIARRDELDIRRKELDAAIAAVEKIIVSGIAHSLQAQTPSSAPQAKPDERQPDLSLVSPRPPASPDEIFKGMTIAEAAVMYLQSVQKSQTAREIAEALKRGGYVFQSKDPSNTVNAVLYRASGRKVLRRVGSAAYAANE